MQTKRATDKELIDNMREFLIFHASGASNAITINDIQQCFNLPTRRDVEHVVESLRMSGVRACSSCRKPMGIYIAQTDEEFKSFEWQMKHRAIRIYQTLKAMRGQRGLGVVKPDAVVLQMELAA